MSPGKWEEKAHICGERSLECCSKTSACWGKNPNLHRKSYHHHIWTPLSEARLGGCAFTAVSENAKFAGPSDRKGYFLSGSGKHPSITGPCDRLIVHCSPFLPHACAKLHLQWVCQKASGSAKNLVSAGPVVWHIKKSFRILCCVLRPQTLASEDVGHTMYTTYRLSLGWGFFTNTLTESYSTSFAATPGTLCSTKEPTYNNVAVDSLVLQTCNTGSRMCISYINYDSDQQLCNPCNESFYVRLLRPGCDHQSYSVSRLQLGKQPTIY